METTIQFQITAEDLRASAQEAGKNLPITAPIAGKLLAMREELMKLTVIDHTDAAGMKAAHEARILVKNTRVAIDKRRTELNEDALRHQRNVNAAAKQLTAILEPAEEYLTYQEMTGEREKERLRKEQLRLEEERIAREREEAMRKREQELKEKMDAELKARQEEQDRQAAEAKARLLEEQGRLDQEARELEERREKAAREEQELNERKQRAAAEEASWNEKIRAEQAEIKAERKRLEEQAAAAKSYIDSAKAREEGRQPSNADTLEVLGIDVGLELIDTHRIPDEEERLVDQQPEPEPRDQAMDRTQDGIPTDELGPGAPPEPTGAALDKLRINHRLQLLEERLEDMHDLNTKAAQAIWDAVVTSVTVATSRARKFTNNLSTDSPDA